MSALNISRRSKDAPRHASRMHAYSIYRQCKRVSSSPLQYAGGVNANKLRRKEPSDDISQLGPNRRTCSLEITMRTVVNINLPARRGPRMLIGALPSRLYEHTFVVC